MMVQLTPEERQAFQVPDSDIENSEEGAMVVQWALLHTLDPTYPVGASLEAFGYGFGRHTLMSETPGQDWQLGAHD